MKAPFQYFGGKRRVAHIVWAALGDVDSYVEPFAGSLAALLARPDSHSKKRETVNDADGLLCNFWRAVKFAPAAVARHAQNPAFECDLIARHRWLRGKRTELTETLKNDPEFFDACAAGWWVWGISNWLGDGFAVRNTTQKVPQMPHGVMTECRRDALPEIFQTLCERLRHVNVLSGDWERAIASHAVVLCGKKNAGVFLDPPYSLDRAAQYAEDSFDNSRVLQWCRVWQDKAKIVLAGYEGEYDLPGWRKYSWKSNGFGNSLGTAMAKDRCSRERLWISPLCDEVNDEKISIC